MSSYFTRSGGAITRHFPTRFRRRGFESGYTTALRLLHTGVATPIRVARRLYYLGCVLDQNRGVLYFNRSFLSGGPTRNDDNLTVSVLESEGPEGPRDGFELEAPATASQVYHAAILNGTTLDDLLAVFEVSEGPSSVDESPAHGDHLPPEYNCLRYRNSSIQTTSESATTPRNTSRTLREAIQDEMSGVDERVYGQLVKATDIGSQTHKKEANASLVQVSSQVTSSSCQPAEDATQSLVCENTSSDHNECPIFARRQAKSRLPQRVKCDAQQQLAANAAAAISSSVSVNVTSGAPSKRKKLQRRAHVFLTPSPSPLQPEPTFAHTPKSIDPLPAIRYVLITPKSLSARLSSRCGAMENFENIFLDLSKQSGRCRLADSGLGWKPSGGADAFTLDGTQIGAAQWSRAAKGYEIKVTTKDYAVLQLDGFDQEDFDRASKAFKIWYGINLESKEHALRGWNWGKAEFGRAELAFNVQNRPAFEIPYSEISNTNQAGKNEIAVEFNLDEQPKENGANGNKTETTKNRGRKAAAARDELVEMRFYIPGTLSKKEANGEEAGSGDDDGEEEEQNAANYFYEMLTDKAQIGDVAGATIATFPDVLHLTPRGRFDIDLYENSFRLRGKTYDYKIQYESIKKFFLLPKTDEVHTLVTMGLEPPLRQGQTRYPFIVMQVKLDDEITVDLNLTEETIETKYKDKLEPHYEAPIHHVIARLFKGLSGKKVIMPSKDFVSHHNLQGIKCSIKANEGLLYCLDKSFMFVPKPATYIQIESIANVVMSRVGGALAASRTFDVTMRLKGGQGEHQFSNINREEQQPLEDFFKAKGIKYKNEMIDDSSNLLKAALQSEELASSDDEGGVRGSADEDDESPDEDFHADSDSDVAEEYDSAHDSSGGSDEDMVDADGDDGDVASEDDKEEEERPKKKSKK